MHFNRQEYTLPEDGRQQDKQGRKANLLLSQNERADPSTMRFLGAARAWNWIGLHIRVDICVLHTHTDTQTHAERG